MQSSKVTAANELMADDTVLNEPENIPETNKPEMKKYTEIVIFEENFTYKINKYDLKYEK